MSEDTILLRVTGVLQEVVAVVVEADTGEADTLRASPFITTIITPPQVVIHTQVVAEATLEEEVVVEEGGLLIPEISLVRLRHTVTCLPL